MLVSFRLDRHPYDLSSSPFYFRNGKGNVLVILRAVNIRPDEESRGCYEEEKCSDEGCFHRVICVVLRHVFNGLRV